MTFWQTILAGVIGTIILVNLQSRAARLKTLEDIRRNDFQEALKAIDQLASAMDKRLQANTRFWERLSSGELEKQDRDDFIKAVDEWMGQYSTLFSKVFHYFGKTERANFSQFQTTLAEQTRIMTRSARLGYDQLSTAHKAEHDDVDQRLRLLRRDVRLLLKRLNEAAAEGRVGYSQYVNDIYHGNADKISRIYLIQRLLGWKS